MSAIWPSISGPDADGHQLSVSPRIASTGMDRGTGRTRLIGRGTTTAVALSFTFTNAEFTTFRDWWETEANHGTEQTEITLRNGYAVYSAIVAWLGPWRASDIGGAWRVSIPAEWIAAPRASADTLADVIAATASDPDALASVDLLHHTVHVTIPWSIDP